MERISLLSLESVSKVFKEKAAECTAKGNSSTSRTGELTFHAAAETWLHAAKVVDAVDLVELKTPTKFSPAPSMGTHGFSTGIADRNGVTIHLGDKLSFDATEFGRVCEFVISFEAGELVHPGSIGDLTEWCEVIEPYHVAAPADPGKQETTDMLQEIHNWSTKRSGATMTVTGEFGTSGNMQPISLTGIVSVRHERGAVYANDGSKDVARLIVE